MDATSTTSLSRPEEITDAVERALVEHVQQCFSHAEGKRMKVGCFLNARAAEAHIVSHAET